MFSPKSLDKILGGFNKIHQDLVAFMDHHSTQQEEKNVEIKKLELEIEAHKTNHARAKKVAERVEEFTSS